jgi:hypothetical protein
MFINSLAPSRVLPTPLQRDRTCAASEGFQYCLHIGYPHHHFMDFFLVNYVESTITPVFIVLQMFYSLWIFVYPYHGRFEFPKPVIQITHLNGSHRETEHLGDKGIHEK